MIFRYLLKVNSRYIDASAVIKCRLFKEYALIIRVVHLYL
jgi:hypothetical protein